MTFGIESSNIVGYTAKEAAQGKFIILGAQFEGVQGGMKINDLVSGVEGVDWDSGYAHQNTAPQIQVPNAVGAYTTYYYLNDGWYDNGTVDGAYKAGWCDLDGTLVDDELTAGVAVWFKSITADASATVAGAVSDDSSSSVTCPEGFALRANVFPIGISLNSNAMISADIVGVDWDSGYAHQNTASQIQVPNAVGAYTTYYYLNDGWYDNGTADGAYKAGWCDLDGTLVDDVIPAAQGFWTKGTSGAFTLTFNK